ncbi:MAG: hypothetical protein K2X27_27950, partial [Candidatus Obscuribacterales bacterium]|nr:hypothetical protein [Candidatus Obscuribacterales bacterium]
MNGATFIAPAQPADKRNEALAPPASRPEQTSRPGQLEPPQRASQWMTEQFSRALRSAMQEQDRNQAFGIYKQALDLADRSRDPVLQGTARVEMGLAIISWGSVENGYQWLLDAGSKNPALYDSKIN